MNDTIKEIQGWKEKALKYDHMDDRYKEYTDKIEAAMTLLKEVQKSLNPVGFIGKTYRKRTDHTEIMEEAYNAMKMGLEIGKAFFTKKEYNETDSANLMTKVSKLAGVDKRKDGRTTYYFLRKVI